jgi:hypothetical protein
VALTKSVKRAPGPKSALVLAIVRSVVTKTER